MNDIRWWFHYAHMAWLGVVEVAKRTKRFAQDELNQQRREWADYVSGCEEEVWSRRSSDL